jgi:hypothetical protein
MATTCLNCGSEITGKYCVQCGQKTTVERLTWHSLLHETVHFFTHIEHGFIKTVRQLLLKPGLVMTSYLEGKRKDFHKPIGFLLIWVAIYLLITGLVNKFGHYEMVDSFAGMGIEVTEMVNKYRSLIEILLLPITSLVGWLIVARPKLNYIEVMVTNLYIISILFIFMTARNFAGLILGINPNTNLMINISVVSYFIWFFYAVYDLYRRLHVEWLIPRIIIFSIICFFVYLFLQIGLAELFIAWGM